MPARMFPKARPTKAPRQKKSIAPVPVHSPVWSSNFTAGLRPERICGECGNGWSHRVHRISPTPPDAVEVDARKLGEGETVEP